MAEFITNPRRAPRAPARCHARVVCPHVQFEADTEDIGAMGCQVVSPQLVGKADAVLLAVTNDKLAEPLQVTGRVAWVSSQAPWRVGIAFDERSLTASARWFEQLIEVYPGLAGFRRVPDRIRTDATVYLGPPPRFLLDFNTDEAVLLRAIASGARVDELMARLRDGWPAAQRALFSLIARQAVTLQRGQAVHPDAWKKILTDIEASLAVESLGKDGPMLAAPSSRPASTPPPVARVAPAPISTARPSATPVPGSLSRAVPAAAPAAGARVGQRTVATGWSGGRPHDPTRVVELDPDDGPPLEIEPIAASPPCAPAQRDEPNAHGQGYGSGPPPDFKGAGVGWRKARQRNTDAQAAFDRAKVEMEAGNVTGALSFLRLALSLAPGDPEIAAALGAGAFWTR